MKEKKDIGVIASVIGMIMCVIGAVICELSGEDGSIWMMMFLCNLCSYTTCVQNRKNTDRGKDSDNYDGPEKI